MPASPPPGRIALLNLRNATINQYHMSTFEFRKLMSIIPL
jgi:hypothetical protein